jgi:hypothetical protein
MPRNWTPSIVPNGHDQNYYLVINNYGQLGAAFVKTDLGQADLEGTISDLMSGQHGDPLRVVAFNTGEYWAEDASRISRAKLCVVSISPGGRCRRQLRPLSSAISGMTGSSH